MGLMGRKKDMESILTQLKVFTMKDSGSKEKKMEKATFNLKATSFKVFLSKM
jgi:hypothetical protein